jgi:hypothetical protein
MEQPIMMSEEKLADVVEMATQETQEMIKSFCAELQTMLVPETKESCLVAIERYAESNILEHQKLLNRIKQVLKKKRNQKRV